MKPLNDDGEPGKDWLNEYTSCILNTRHFFLYVFFVFLRLFILRYFLSKKFLKFIVECDAC